MKTSKCPKCGSEVKETGDREFVYFNCGSYSVGGALQGQSHVCQAREPLQSALEAAERENQRLMDGLKALKTDVHWPIDFYAKNGPSVTSPTGHEYEHTNYVLAKMEELESAIDALLQPEKEPT